MSHTLTADQVAGYDAFCHFILDPTQEAFVLRGYSGTGKTTLMSHFIDQYPALRQTLRLLNPNTKHEYELVFTATTNKAAEALSLATGVNVTTVQSKLGLRVHTDYKSNTSRLVARNGVDNLEDAILVVDEASFIDHQLLNLIFQKTTRCKIVFVGDPAQLLTVGCSRSPVFDAGFPEARLTEVVRQKNGNPIIDLSTKFRDTVESGDWFAFTPDGHHIQHLPREDFEQEVCSEFMRTDRHHQDSRVLAWTNKTVIAYNKAISKLVSGTPDLAVGDYAICNRYMMVNKVSIKTDQMVQVTHIGSPDQRYDVDGRMFTLDNKVSCFMPDSQAAAKKALNKARKDNQLHIVQEISDQWLDLREAYANTINKSQGSTYGKVYIDLDDLSKCRNANQLARMLYVGVSRARDQVYLTGDLV